MNRIGVGFRLIGVAALALALCVSPLTAAPVHASGVTIRVAPGGLTSGTCGSDFGVNACDLQYALVSVAQSGDSLWIKEGTYTPGAARTDSFILRSGVHLYGGFDGGETSFDDRDWEVDVTTLSGEIGDPGTTVDNSIHVVTAGAGTANTAELDGFTITAGNANGSSSPTDQGGGVYLYDADPVLSNLTISGNEAVQGAGMVSELSSPSLTNVTFSANSASVYTGGMFNDQSSPVLVDVQFEDNTGNYRGGGMTNSNCTSELRLTNVTFHENSARHGGGMYNSNSDPSLHDVTFDQNHAPAAVSADGFGGGIYNIDSDPTLTNVTFSGNTAPGSVVYSGYGGGIYNDNSDPVLNTVTFSNNAAGGDGGQGGGMYSWDGSDPTLIDVSFSGNSARQGAGMFSMGGTQSLTDVTFLGNTTTGSYGGGMFNAGSSATLTRVTFTGNSATNGAGMVNSGTGTYPHLADVTFDSNTASWWGGGMYNDHSSPILTNVTFSGNSAVGDPVNGSGGGMMNYDSGSGPSNPTLTNVTFSGNSAAKGGALYNSDSSPTLWHVTMAGNTATAGAGIYNASGAGFIRNSILWNPGDELAWPFSSDYLTITDSVLEGGCPGASGQVCTNNVTGDPLLQALADNGGQTPTMALGAGSSAIDVASSTYSTPTDQRGASRPQDGDLDDTSHADAGAYEFEVFSIAGNTGVGGVTLSYAGDTNGTTTSDAGGAYSFSVPEHWTGRVTPLKTRCTFTDAYTDYSDVMAGMVGQNYTATCTASFRSFGPYDGWVMESSEGSGAGASKNVAAETFNLGDNAADRQYRGILSFNTATLPDTAVLQAVKLRLTQSAVVGSNPFDTMTKIMIDMKNGSFGASSLEIGDFEAGATKSSATSILNNPSGDTYTKSLSSTLFQYINPMGLSQLRLRFYKDDNDNRVADYLLLYSGNATTASLRPTLIITYHVP